MRTLNIYKYRTLVSKNVYIDKSDDIVNKYNNTYHSTIKMKSVDVKSNIFFLKTIFLGENVKVELDLSNYTIKRDLKNGKGDDTSSFAKKTDLANLKSNVD